MLPLVRKKIIKELWSRYLKHCSQEAAFVDALQKKSPRSDLPIDHFAIIDLPSAHSGISILQHLFTLLGFVLQGRGYIEEKQNEFAWLTCMNAFHSTKEAALPQVVIADFKLDAMPDQVQTIIQRYTQHINPPPLGHWATLSQKSAYGDAHSSELLAKEIVDYLCTPSWPTPTAHDVHIVKQYNDLLAWVLIHGKRVNHFTLSIHLLSSYSDLTDFHRELNAFPDLTLNTESGTIKGHPSLGIEQSSTAGTIESIISQNESIETTCGFLEFIWRHPKHTPHSNKMWFDLHQNFIAHQANFVIESLCNKKNAWP